MSSIQQFQGARNVMITGGSFSQIQYAGGRDEGLHILRQHIAADAIYDSAERFPPAKCHPGTREKIIKTIMEWIDDPVPTERALWLHGPAGAGKSAIAHSIALLLQKIAEDSKYAASFFFARDAIGRGDGNYLFSTIAYQLALKFPSLRAIIDAAMLDNPTLPTKSIDVQLRCLIIEPLKCDNDWPAHSPTVIIDGLDECSGSKCMQSEILSAISNAIIEHDIPLRFLIVSRPEYWIADLFELGPLARVTRLLSLRDNEDADGDINKYLRERFDKIYDENIRIMSSTPRPWPPDYIIHRFLTAASGQFVYASTVLNFVESSSNFCDPRGQLLILTTPGPHHASAFTDLDKLYATILSTYPRLDSLKCVLGGILVSVSQTSVQELLGVGAAEFQLALSALSSLIKISRPPCSEIIRDELEPIFGSVFCEAMVSFYHLSFEEFLENESRSGKYAVDREVITARLACAVLNLGNALLQDIPHAEGIIARMGLSAFRKMLHHFSGMPVCDSGILDALRDVHKSLQIILAANPSHIPHANHVLWFTTATSEALPRLANLWQHQNQKEYDNHLDLFESLKGVLDVVRSISARQLLERSLKTTPTFAYLASHCTRNRFEYHSTVAIAEVMSVDVHTIISDLQHLRDWIYMQPAFTSEAPQLYPQIVVIGGVFRDELYKLTDNHLGRQQVVEWDNRRLTSSALFFQQIRNNNCRSDEFHEGLWYADGFIRYNRVSDIQSKEYFEDANKMAIFDLIMDSSFWDHTNYRAYSIELVLGTLAWFNRQLTEDRLYIIAEHDNTLPHKMRCMAKRIFENCFLPHFISGVYCSALVMVADYETDIPSVALDIDPPVLDGIRSIVQERIVDGSRLPRYHFEPVTFHKYVKVFEKEVLEDCAGNTIISYSDWYPHLAASLLAMLVKNQYGTLNDDFEKGWSCITMKCFVPLIRCLPYAIPLQQNLNAIRALHYLYLKIGPNLRWRPPFGFCSLAIEFLKKYDSSSLSSLEFHTLKDWLSVMSRCESRRIITSDDQCMGWSCDRDCYTSDEDSSS